MNFGICNTETKTLVKTDESWLTKLKDNTMQCSKEH